MSFFDGLDEFSHGLSDFAIGTSKLLDISTVYDDYTLVLNDGSLASVLEIEGSMRDMDSDELMDRLENITHEFSSILSTQGVSLAIHYRYDPLNKTENSHVFNLLDSNAKQFGMNIEDLVFDWKKSLDKLTQVEQVFLVIYTGLTSMAPANRAEQRKEMVKANKKIPFVRGIQRIENIATRLATSHESRYNTLLSLFNNDPLVAMKASKVRVDDVLHDIRSHLFPNITGGDWKPLLPGDRLPRRYSDEGMTPDYTDVLYPSFDRQLFREEIEQPDARSVVSGGIQHYPCMLDIPPMNPVLFDDLLRRMIDSKRAWSVSFFMDGDGLNGMGIKSLLATLFATTSSQNRRFSRAMKGLKEYSEMTGEAVTRNRVVFDIWGPVSQSEEVLQDAEEMYSKIQSWGRSDIERPVGFAAKVSVASSQIGLKSKPPANMFAAPINAMIPMMPFDRPASFWDKGLPFRTRDGTLFPFEQGSSKQTSFVDVGIGEMGQGKSVVLNVINLAFILSGGSDIPYLSILDIGVSSSGLISMIKNALPENKRYLAIYERLRMTDEYAINPFDTPMGAKEPLPMHKDFLVNFLCTLVTPAGSNEVPKNFDNISRRIIDMAYFENHSQRPKLYSPSFDPRAPNCRMIDQRIIEMGFDINQRTSWFDIRDMFFAEGKIEEAGIAHTYAMPLLSEVAAFSKREEITSVYGEQACNDYYTAISDAAAAYPIIGKYTRFSLGAARIVALDLDLVAPRGGAVANKQTAVMYMLARHVAVTRFFASEDDTPLYDPMYREYQNRISERMRKTFKRASFDEVHRVSTNPGVRDQFIADTSTVVRESRKWNIFIGMYSQSAPDIPDVIAELSTVLFLMGSFSGPAAIKAANVFGLTDHQLNAIQRMSPPTSRGSNMLARFRTLDGQVVQSLSLTLGPLILWALSTSAEDAGVRDRLYKKMPASHARAILAKLYPGGSIKTLAKRMQDQIAEKTALDDPDDRAIYAMLSAGDTLDQKIEAADVLVEKIFKAYNNSEIRNNPY